MNRLCVILAGVAGAVSLSLGNVAMSQAAGANSASDNLAASQSEASTTNPGSNMSDSPQPHSKTNPDIYRPSATVNGEIITATDIEQRLALVRIANKDAVLPPEEEERIRSQIFSNLVDETLQIQEAKANDIIIDEAVIDEQFARLAAQFRQTPAQFTEYLRTQNSSAAALKQQIRGEFAWDRLLARNIRSFTNVSHDEVEAIADRLQQARGTDEFRLGEIYLSASSENTQVVLGNAGKIVKALRSGGSFQAYARQFSEASTAIVGGDLGWVRAAQLPPSIAEAAAQMQPGQMVGPIEVPGGFSIIVLIDQRKVLTTDPRDAILSLKQISLDFPPGVTDERATEIAEEFSRQTRSVAGCGMADTVAANLDAKVVARDQITMRSLPPPLQETLLGLQTGQITQPFGSRSEGISVLILCGRDFPEKDNTPDMQAIEQRMLEEKVNKKARLYLRDLRRDAVIKYHQ